MVKKKKKEEEEEVGGRAWSLRGDHRALANMGASLRSLVRGTLELLPRLSGDLDEWPPSF